MILRSVVNPEATILSGIPIVIATVVSDSNTRPMNFTKNIGMILLAVFLILSGLMSLGVFTISSMIMGILALLAGIFILIGK
jgi:hypothetical protein